MTGLNQKKAELAAVEANLAALNAKLKEMQVNVQASCQLHALVCLIHVLRHKCIAACFADKATHHAIRHQQHTSSNVDVHSLSCITPALVSN